MSAQVKWSALFEYSSVLRLHAIIACMITTNCQQMLFHALTDASGSPLCDTDTPMYSISITVVNRMSPWRIPDVIRCAYNCTESADKTGCVGFNYLNNGTDSSKCEFYNNSTMNCNDKRRGCIFYEVCYHRYYLVSFSRKLLSSLSIFCLFNQMDCIIKRTV